MSLVRTATGSESVAHAIIASARLETASSFGVLGSCARRTHEFGFDSQRRRKRHLGLLRIRFKLQGRVQIIFAVTLLSQEATGESLRFNG